MKCLKRGKSNFIIYRYCILLLCVQILFYFFFCSIKGFETGVFDTKVIYSRLLVWWEYTVWNACICSEDLSLKTRLMITHPGARDTGRCLTSEHISDWGQPPRHNRPHTQTYCMTYYIARPNNNWPDVYNFVRIIWTFIVSVLKCKILLIQPFNNK